jgi:hypothetical protein
VVVVVRLVAVDYPEMVVAAHKALLVLQIRAVVVVDGMA